MGITSEIWAECDLCEYSKSFNPLYFNPNNIPGFAFNPAGLLICQECDEKDS